MRTFLRIFILLFVASTCGFSITTQASGAALSRSRLNFVLLQAAKSGDLAKVKRALAGGADVNVRDPQGTTPLMLAASGGYEAIVKLLLTQGADSHIKRKDNETALSLAISS
ncbi:MAG TPA: ankyrin repeat domain-containing protein, partial [Capsulimonadaceae bacterium]|nr:ankyrin repeat domain-containing protein [Capsulimonadaceae bacterium]